MARNERVTCKELIEPALATLGWDWEEQLRIGPGRVNLTGDSPSSMYDETHLDHYALFGIDDLEQARTYGAPQFVEQFGSFQTLSRQYGGAPILKADLEAVKQHLYVPMVS